MTFNIPIQSRLISTSVNNENPDFDNTLQQVIFPSAKLEYNNNVFINATVNNISFPDYVAETTYLVGDITFKDGKIKRLASIGETLVLKDPWEYDSLITGGYCLGGATVLSPDKGRYWEPFADPVNNYPQSIYFNISNDLSNGYQFEILRDGNFMRARVLVDGVEQVRAETSYCSVAYSAATMAVEGSGIKQLASIKTSTTPVTCIFPILASSAVYISSDGRIVFLSNPAYPYEYKTVTTNVWEDVVSPVTLGMSYYGISRQQYPFDTKQYTSVIEANLQTWTIESLDSFNGVAIGSLKGEQLQVQFRDSTNSTIQSVERAIDGSIYTGIAHEPISEIIYCTETIDAGGFIIITITGAETEVGFIFPCIAMEVGMTDLEFSHDIKNFDRNVVSEISGYIDHIKGNRVVQHRGSFNIEMLNYDKMVRLNKKITQELIAIDGSDTILNETADGINRFASTKILGRVKQLSMKSKTKNGDMSKYTTVTFEFEEVV